MINVAILGAGSIGTIHAANLSAHPAFRLIAVADPDVGRADDLATRFGGEALASADDACARPDVDAVVIASSTSAHAEHIGLAVANGCHLLCEKPVSTTLDDAVDAIRLVEASEIVAAMGFNRRLDAAYGDLRRRVANGEAGSVEMMRLVSRSDTPPAPESARTSGGMIREKGAHFYDLACWLADCEPVEISAMGGCLIDPAFADYGDVDTAVLTLRFETGALAGFDFGRRTTFGCDEMIEVFGSRALLCADRQPVRGATVLSGEGQSVPGLDATWRTRFGATYIAELDTFASAIQGDSDVHATLRDGLRAQAVAEAALEALQSGATVVIDPVWRR